MQPYRDPQRTSLWDWLAQFDRLVGELVPDAWIRVLGYIVAVFLLLVCAYSQVEALALARLRSDAVPTTSAPTVVPETVTPTSPVLAPQLITGAHLGGPDSAMAQQFGQPANGIYYTSVAGQQAMLTMGEGPGMDGTLRAYDIMITPPTSRTGSQTWTRSAMQDFVHALLPPDAVNVGTEPGPEGSLIYDMHSDQLAATGHQSDFTNEANTRDVPLGSLYWTCYLHFDKQGTGVDFCNVSVGTYN